MKDFFKLDDNDLTGVSGGFAAYAADLDKRAQYMDPSGAGGSAVGQPITPGNENTFGNALQQDGNRIASAPDGFPSR